MTESAPMQQVNITYDKLFEILRSEKNNADLQKLPEHFVNDLVQYLALKNQMLTQGATNDFLSASQQDMTQQQVRNALRIISEILDRREKKIVLMALNKARAKAQVIDTQSMLEKEKDFFSNLVLLLTNHRTDISNTILQYKSAKIQHQSTPSVKKEQPQPTDGPVLFKVITAIPAFVGPDMKEYGPYAVGEQVEVGEQVAKILLKRGQIEEIKA